VALAKIANTFLAAGIPTKVGMQEVVNIGILEDLAAWDSFAVYDYQPVLVEGTDSRGIDESHLVRCEHTEILDVQHHIAPEGLASRPSLLVKVEIGNNRGDIMLFALSNHFSSLAGGEAATKPRRTAQAAWNVTITGANPCGESKCLHLCNGRPKYLSTHVANSNPVGGRLRTQLRCLA